MVYVRRLLLPATIKNTVPVKGCNKIKIYNAQFAQIAGYGDKEIVIRDPAFIWSNSGLGFYHVFIDLLNDWLICKENIPNLKLYVLQSEPNAEDILNDMQPFYAELFKMLPVEDVIREDEYKTIQFNDLYFCSNEMNFAIKDKVFPNDKFGTVSGIMNPRFYEWHLQAFKNLREFFKDYLYTGEPYSKIYVSRKAEHEKIDKFFKMSDGDDMNEVFKKTMLGDDQYKERSVYRYFDPEEEEKVEQFFSNLDYSIVDFSKMSLLEQIIISSTAKVMVGFHGAGMLNAAYMQPESTVMLLNTCNVNTFYHTELHRLDKHKVYEFPPRGIVQVKPGINVPFKELDVDTIKVLGLDHVVQYRAQDIIDYATNNDFIVGNL